MDPKKLIFFILFFPLIFTFGQGYHLEVGEKYRLYQSYNQNTISETSNVGGNVSLDITSSTIIEITGIIDTVGYAINCKYEDLQLSLFSSDMNLTISSETRDISLIMKYIDKLKEYTFNGIFSFTGELLSISNLDKQIALLYLEKEENYNEQDLIIKTISEAFGEDAFRSLINLSMHVHCKKPETRCLKDVTYSFNARPIILHNTFYIQPAKNKQIRIQGIGAIESKQEVIEFESGTITSNLKGNQTFDHLYDEKSGWLIEGRSKQKIYVLTVFHGSTNLPEGLEVPSITETEFEFYGGKIEEAN